MSIEKLITDTIVDAVSETRVSVYEKSRYKKGFFLKEPFFLGRTALKSRKKLITERYIMDKIRNGQKTVKIPQDAVITPMAKLLIEEGRIKAVEE